MTSWTRCTLRFTDADNRTQPAARQSRVEVDAMPGKGGDHGRPGRQQRMRALILASLPTGPFADALKTRDILADKGFLLRDINKDRATSARPLAQRPERPNNHPVLTPGRAHQQRPLKLGRIATSVAGVCDP